VVLLAIHETMAQNVCYFLYGEMSAFLQRTSLRVTTLLTSNGISQEPNVCMRARMHT
jgi:hypothetical protein